MSLHEIKVPLDILEENSSYIVRARHVGATHGESEWTNLIVSTKEIFSPPPVLISPSNGTADFRGEVIAVAVGQPEVVQWMASDNNEFTSVVDSLEDNESFTAWSPSVDLSVYKETNIYVRARYKVGSKWSEWSNVLYFVTPNIQIANPILSVSGAPDSITEIPTLSASAFLVENGEDTHHSTTWVIELPDGSPIWSVTSETDLTSIDVPADILEQSNTYVFKVQYHGAVFGDSGEVSKTHTLMSVYIDDITLEVEGAPSDLPKVPVMRITSDFTVVNGTDDHASTDWELLEEGVLVWSETASTTNLLTMPIAMGVLQEGGLLYTFRARVNSANYGSSEWASTSGVTPDSFPLIAVAGDPDEIGKQLEGGLYSGGNVMVDNTEYALIVASKLTGGEFKGKQDSTNDGYINVYSGELRFNGKKATQELLDSELDGMKNAEVLIALNDFNTNNTTGYNDWHIPSYQEIKMMYYYLKPTTRNNYYTSGTNNYDVNPLLPDFTSTVPTESVAGSFREGGSEEFSGNDADVTYRYYLTSNWYGANSSYIRFYDTYMGEHNSGASKSGEYATRFVRWSPVGEIVKRTLFTISEEEGGGYGESPTISVNDYNSSHFTEDISVTHHKTTHIRIIDDSGDVVYDEERVRIYLGSDELIANNLLIPPGTLSPGGTYTFQTSHISNDNRKSAWASKQITLNNFEPVAELEVATPWLEADIGGLYKGGFYSGTNILEGNEEYELIVSPFNIGNYVGVFDSEMVSGGDRSVFSPSTQAKAPFDQFTSDNDYKWDPHSNGKRATQILLDTFQTELDTNADGLEILKALRQLNSGEKSDYTDWHIPAVKEVELLFRLLNPIQGEWVAQTSQINDALPISAEAPSYSVQTVSDIFKLGGFESLRRESLENNNTVGYYLSSTVYSNGIYSYRAHNSYYYDYRTVKANTEAMTRFVRWEYKGKVVQQPVISVTEVNTETPIIGSSEYSSTHYDASGEDFNALTRHRFSIFQIFNSDDEQIFQFVNDCHYNSGQNSEDVQTLKIPPYLLKPGETYRADVYHESDDERTSDVASESFSMGSFTEEDGVDIVVPADELSVGKPYKGGYYVGCNMMEGNEEYELVIAPRVLGGEYVGVFDSGMGTTRASVEYTHSSAKFVEYFDDFEVYPWDAKANGKRATRILMETYANELVDEEETGLEGLKALKAFNEKAPNGYDDWHIPSQGELKEILRYLDWRPGQWMNTATGNQYNSIPIGGPYPAYSVPTVGEYFAKGEIESVRAAVQINNWEVNGSAYGYYFSSTVYAAGCYSLNMDHGYEYDYRTILLNASYRTRFVRWEYKGKVVKTPTIGAVTNGTETPILPISDYDAGHLDDEHGATRGLHTFTHVQVFNSGGDKIFDDMLDRGYMEVTDTDGTLANPKIPNYVIEPGQTYSVVANYESQDNRVSDNASVSLSSGSFTPALSSNPTVTAGEEASAGVAFGGGYYAGGNIVVDGTEYRLILAPRALGGEYHGVSDSTASNIYSHYDYDAEEYKWENGKWATEFLLNNHPDVENCELLSALNEFNAKSPNGHNDWHIPSKWELEIMYRFLKPSSTYNAGAPAAGVFSVPNGPTHTAYIPAITSNEDFRQGGFEALSAYRRNQGYGYYISSNFYGSTLGYLYMANGSWATNGSKTALAFCRFVRWEAV